MYVSAKVDYAMRALLELAAADATEPGKLVTGEHLAQAQDIPPRFLEAILRQLRQAQIVTSRRGAEGGYRLARPSGEITVAEVVRWMGRWPRSGATGRSMPRTSGRPRACRTSGSRPGRRCATYSIT
jgi:Rrf2 family protein